MSKLFASWVSGHAVVPETMGGSAFDWAWDAYSDVTGTRGRGGYTNFRIKGGTDNWFSYPIPTPVIVEDQRATLARVMFLFTFGPGATIDTVEVRDSAMGGRQLLNASGLTLGGDYAGKIVDNENGLHVFGDHPVLWESRSACT